MCNISISLNCQNYTRTNITYSRLLCVTFLFFNSFHFWVFFFLTKTLKLWGKLKLKLHEAKLKLKPKSIFQTLIKVVSVYLLEILEDPNKKGCLNLWQCFGKKQRARQRWRIRFICKDTHTRTHTRTLLSTELNYDTRKMQLVNS